MRSNIPLKRGTFLEHPILNTCTLLFFTVACNVLSLNDAKQCDYPAIFNFGDSNSDTGGLSALFGHPVWDPNGETFFNGSAGRLCDGRLVIDFLAESLGIAMVNPYLKSVGSNFSQGANFATAGSTVRRQNTTVYQSGFSPIALDVQLHQFSDFLKTSQLARKQGVFESLLPKEEYFESALYTFDIGGNDLIAGYQLGMSTQQIKAFVPDVVAQFAKVVRGVYTLGGRSFWIHNTGPLGCLPSMLNDYPVIAAQKDDFGCAISMNEAAQFYNAKLKDAVDQLKKDLPLATITYVDVYSLKYTLATQPKQFGFEEGIGACCGIGGKYNYDATMKCGFAKKVNGEMIIIAKSCKNPSLKVNWDGTHFTEAANKLIFQQLILPFCSPTSSLITPL